MSAAIKLDLNAEKRRVPRRTVIEEARIISKRGGWSLIDCMVRDISKEGAKVQIAPSVEVPSEFDLLLVKEMQIIPVRIRWRRREFIGVQFTAPPREAPPFCPR